MNFPRAKGRPSKSLVDRQKLSAAALEIVATDGYDKLTMTAVARHLGVATSALYNHIQGKQGLLALVEDAVMAQVDTAALEDYLTAASASESDAAAAESAAAESGAGATADISAALKGWARSYRAVLAAHRPLIEHIAVMPIYGTRETVEMYDLLVRCLGRAGVDESAVMDVIVAFESFIFGSAFDVTAPADIFAVPSVAADVEATGAEAGRAEAAGVVHDGAVPVDRVSAPALSAALHLRKAEKNGANPYADAPFEMGLEALVKGLVG